MAARWKRVLFNNITLVIMVVIKLSFAFEREHFVFWPNGTVPFYVNPTHFDKEQSLAILSSLSLFTFKTCLQFRPVMVEPSANQHVMLFENPRGVRKCVIDMEGHAKEEPHRLTLGYECLRSPQFELVIMKALGFPFEHNRAIRDIYIDVQFENIEPGYIPFFTKEKILPLELRSLPYDVDSVMHFGERDYSKNGHRSFIFKNKQTQQTRIGLSKTDYRKIEIIYGPECQKRDRQAKIDICKKYPSVRRKRAIVPDVDIVQNLRINRDITPPPEKDITDEITSDVKQLNIDKEIQDLIELVHKISAAALENERVRICNNTNTNTRKSYNTNDNVTITQNASSDISVRSNDMTKIIEVVVNHVKDVVTSAKTNLSIFCDATNSIELFQRARCRWGAGNRCPPRYKPTLSGPMRYSTKHRPIIKQFTTHDGRGKRIQYANLLRSRDDTHEAANATKNKLVTREMNITDLNKANIKENDSFIITANDTKITIRKKRDIEMLNTSELTKFTTITNDVITLNTTDEKNYSFKTTGNAEKNTNVKRKREAETITLPDDSVMKKSNESLSNYTVKESVVKTDEKLKNVNVDGNTDMLRMTTRVFSDKKVAFAPVNRRHRELFGHSDSVDMDKEEKRDDSSSLERDKRKTRTTKIRISIRNKLDRERARDERRERERERPTNRDRNTDNEEDRAQNKRHRVKKRGKQRSPLPETVPLTKANKEFYADRIWPDGVVRYVISQDSTYNLRSIRARLEEVNEILKKKTCVRIEEISDGEGQAYKDYLVIDTSADYVTGRVGGRQVMVITTFDNLKLKLRGFQTRPGLRRSPQQT